jgi:hypothetical protein
MDMGIKKTLKYYLLGESLKEIELNRILDKISSKKLLSDRENKFLELYNQFVEEDDRDFMYLSKNLTYKKITFLLESNKKVICDLSDRDGKIGLPILKIENKSILMKNNEIHVLQDKFLYNIIYNNKCSQYSLQEQDEYFEKIMIDK